MTADRGESCDKDFTSTRKAIKDFHDLVDYLCSQECSVSECRDRTVELEEKRQKIAECFAQDTGQNVGKVQSAFGCTSFTFLKNAMVEIKRYETYIAARTNSDHFEAGLSEKE